MLAEFLELLAEDLQLLAEVLELLVEVQESFAEDPKLFREAFGVIQWLSSIASKFLGPYLPGLKIIKN